MITHYRIERLSHTEFTVTCVMASGSIVDGTVKTFATNSEATENAIGRAGKMSILTGRAISVVMTSGRVYTFNASAVPVATAQAQEAAQESAQPAI